MNKIIFALLFSAMPLLAYATGGNVVPLEKANSNLDDTKSLQKGARLFVNYCLSCHSAARMRYQRMAEDLNISEELMLKNLMFASDKIGDTMEIAMTAKDGKDWFGVPPPDLSVIARSRSPDWLYTYLISFYVDESRPFGVNNALFKDVAMPHVLWELEGLKIPRYKIHTDEYGNTIKEIDSFETLRPGKLNAAEYKESMRDLVNFLVYLGEPAKLVRYQVGVWVILFLIVLLVFSYAMKKEFWKDIH